MSGEEWQARCTPETEWVGMPRQRPVCQGWRIRALTFPSTLAHCHLSTAPSLACVSTMCLSRFPAKLAGLQHRGLSPRRLSRRAERPVVGGRGPSELFLGTDLGSTSPFSFCLLCSPLALTGLSPPSSHRWDLWLRSLSFNFQLLLLSLTHTR